MTHALVAHMWKVNLLKTGFASQMVLIIVTNSSLQSKNQFHFPGKVVKVNFMWESTYNIFALIFFFLELQHPEIYTRILSLLST